MAADSGNISRKADVIRPSLGDSVQYLKGVGPQRAAALRRLGIETVDELLRHYPLRHEDRRQVIPVHELVHGVKQATCVTVRGKGDTERRRGLQITRVPVSDGYARAYLTWFNQPYMAERFKPGDRLFVYGKVNRFLGTVSIESPEYEVITGDDVLQTGRIVPVYPLTEGVSQSQLRRVIYGALQKYLSLVEDPLPESLRAKFRLLPLGTALQNIHFPSSPEDIERARRRLVFEELFLLQCALLRRKSGIQDKSVGFPMTLTNADKRRFLESLPFELTNAQRRVCREVLEDMSLPRPMNRLLHGDVGSGKTVIAALTLFNAVRNGFQAAVMAPTEILAEQHARVFADLLRPLGISVEYLAGSLKGKERAAVHHRLASGEAQVVTGTHALIQEDVAFAKLGMVVIDEQHRFGVLQRASLVLKGTSPEGKAGRPHTLVMTATPIPRTLALTVYGDLDVSVLDELPPGRQVITTRWLKEKQREKAYEFVRQEVRKGRQAYVVCPLVEESEKLGEIEAAVQMAERLQKEVFPDLVVGLVHGRMGAAEREAVMQRFLNGEIHILTATTVIEVGIDVANVSVILIEDAHRFGLAQLHQLRGRVGRSAHKSYCLLLGRATTEEGRARLEALVATNDGFRIAEEDLRLRGPGELYGTKQHGLPDLRIADLVRDVNILQVARREAESLLQTDPDLRSPSHQRLREKLATFGEGRLEKVLIG